MKPGQRLILIAGIIASLVQLGVPPQRVAGHFMLGGGTEVTRRVPLGWTPEYSLRLRTHEIRPGAGINESVLFVDSVEVDATMLAVQLAATALVVALAMLVVGSVPKEPVPIQSDEDARAPDEELPISSHCSKCGLGLTVATTIHAGGRDWCANHFPTP